MHEIRDEYYKNLMADSHFEATLEELEGVPEETVSKFKSVEGEDSTKIVTIDSFDDILTRAANSEVRLKAIKAMSSGDFLKNEPLIGKTIRLRQQSALL
jgi:Zn-dependent oligopeptidase